MATAASDFPALAEALERSSSVGFACLGLDYRFTRVNEAFASLTGLPVEQHLGRSGAEVAPAVLSQLQGLCRGVIDTGAPVVDHEVVGDGSAGRRRCWLHSVYPVREDGVIVGVGVLVVDGGERMSSTAARVQEDGTTSLYWFRRTREALQEDRLLLYSQPIVPLRGGPPAEELLLRMIDRDGTIIPPGDFLPAAEEHALICDIDRWVISQAARRAAQGRRVQVNVSALSLDRSLIDHIDAELRDASADPGNLIFELTETAMLGNLSRGQRFATELERIGCEFALDDFGTGFASLTYLKQLPATYLKIGCDFVRDLTTNVIDRHVVKMIVHLARGLGKQTIAEGVETEATLDLLRSYGVDYVQGFYLGRPAPMENHSG